MSLRTQILHDPATVSSHNTWLVSLATRLPRSSPVCGQFISSTRTSSACPKSALYLAFPLIHFARPMSGVSTGFAARRWRWRLSSICRWPQSGHSYQTSFGGFNLVCRLSSFCFCVLLEQSQSSGLVGASADEGYDNLSLQTDSAELRSSDRANEGGKAHV